MGGIVKQGVTIQKRKSIITEGSHLIYPSREAYRKVKSNLTYEINKLSRNSVIEVINACNRIITG
jgi:hypothetical protein